MMNHARLGVGVEGVGIAPSARIQHALEYARTRVPGPRNRTEERRSGDDHSPSPDVKRMLLTMKSQTEGD